MTWIVIPSIKLSWSDIRKDKLQFKLKPIYSHFQRYKCSLDSQTVESEAKPFLKHQIETQLYKSNFPPEKLLESFHTQVLRPFHFHASQQWINSIFCGMISFFLHCIHNILDLNKINTCLTRSQRAAPEFCTPGHQLPWGSLHWPLALSPGTAHTACNVSKQR